MVRTMARINHPEHKNKYFIIIITYKHIIILCCAYTYYLQGVYFAVRTNNYRRRFRQSSVSIEKKLPNMT